MAHALPIALCLAGSFMTSCTIPPKAEQAPAHAASPPMLTEEQTRAAIEQLHRTEFHDLTQSLNSARALLGEPHHVLTINGETDMFWWAPGQFVNLYFNATDESGWFFVGPRCWDPAQRPR